MEARLAEGTMAAKWRNALISCLAQTQPNHARDTWLVPGLTRLESKLLEHAFPAAPRAAAVLIPIVEYPRALTVLLTTRATQLRNHAGQISFPGGSLEAGETPCDGALREAYEEIGLRSDFVSLLGYLPDHILLTGFRITPVVALVRPGFEIHADSSEVHDVFEAPLDRLLDISNYVISRRRAGPDWGHALREEIELETYSVRVAGRNIWGATAGILFNLARRCAPALQ